MLREFPNNGCVVAALVLAHTLAARLDLLGHDGSSPSGPTAPQARKSFAGVLSVVPVKRRRHLPFILVLGLLSGCVSPIPHTTPRSGEVRGRVLDARTGLPVQGAKVSFIKSPHHATYTDAAGHFRLKAARDFHFAYVSPEGDWPSRKDSLIEITHPDYKPRGLSGGVGPMDIGDFLLKPKK